MTLKKSGLQAAVRWLGVIPALPRGGIALALALIGTPAAQAASTITRTSWFDYEPGSGILRKEITEPSSSSSCVVTEYLLDAFGRRQTATTRNCNGSAATFQGALTEPASPGDNSAAAFESRTTTTMYSANHLVVTTSNALSHTEVKTLDGGFGNVQSLQGPNQLTTSWAYDALGRKIRERRPDDNGTEWTYQFCAGVAGGSLNCPTVGGVAGAYAMTATPIRFTSATTWVANGPYTTIYFDALGREIRSVKQGADVGTSRLIHSDTEYNALGQVVRKSRPYFSGETVYWVSYGYDVVGRVISEDAPTETAPSGAITRTTHNGLVTSVTNPLNQTTTEEKNVAGELFRSTDAMGGTLERRYDAQGNLAQIKDAAGNITSLTYDLRGRKTAMYDPDMGVWEYCYDAFGQLKAQQSPAMRGGSDSPSGCPASTGKGVTAVAVAGWATMAYDKLGRMTQRIEPDATSTWSYDKYADQSACSKGIGKLCQVAGANGYGRRHVYDSLGRLSTTTTTVGTSFTAGVSYDGQGRPEVLTYPSGLSVRNTYTTLGFLNSVLDNRNSSLLWRADRMDEYDRVVEFTHGNGVVTTQRYYPGTGQLDTIQAGLGASVQNLVHTRDAGGRLKTRTDMLTGVSAQYEYDDINRLRKETRGGGSLSGSHLIEWTYDAIGNMTSRKEGGTTNTYNYNPSGWGSNKPHAVANVSGFVNGYGVPFYAYDANGNLTGGAGRSVSWTSDDKVKTVSRGSARLEYLYDVDGERTQESYYLNGSLQRATIYLNPAAGAGLYYEDETGAAGTKRKHYIGASGTVAMIVCTADPCTSLSNTTTQYWHKDHLASVSVITNSAGAVVERLAYEPFGKRRQQNGIEDQNGTLVAVNTDRGFTGHEHMEEVGLVNMNGRVYDAGLGRFMSADPVIQSPGNLQSYNRYAYAWNVSVQPWHLASDGRGDNDVVHLCK